MAAENVAFLFASRPRSRDWTSQELAEFYRVESALIQGGMKISTDRGVSDEGDPWFVFCREEGGDPVVHFARIDGQYIIASPAYKGVARGLDFRSMVQELISRHKLAPAQKEQKSNIFMHPAALLVIVVGTAFFKTPGEARADELRKDGKTADGSGGSVTHAGRKLTGESDSVSLSTIDYKLELAQNMSQLLIVAASTMLTADADQSSPQTQTSAAIFPSETWSDDGKNDGYGVASHHQPIVHLNSDGFEIAASDQSTSLVAQPPASSSPQFGDVAFSALKLMTDLNGIPAAHSGNSSDLTHIFVADNGLSPVAGGFNNEVGFLATKAVGTSAEFSAAQIAGVIHAGASASELIVSQGNSFYENGTVVEQFPGYLTNVASLATVGTQVGNADNFLAVNNIFVELRQDGSIALASMQLASSANHDTTATTAMGDHLTEFFTTSRSTVTPTSTSTSTSSGVDAGTATVTTGNSTESITGTVFLKTLELFLEETPSVGVSVSHDHFIFYNSESTAPASNESITMAFTDGSSIEIVGQASMLVNIIAHAQA